MTGRSWGRGFQGLTQQGFRIVTKRVQSAATIPPWSEVRIRPLSLSHLALAQVLFVLSPEDVRVQLSQPPPALDGDAEVPAGRRDLG
jgi:hypothetical protein